MRYSQIREMDISNGEGIGVSLFVQGCHFHCKGCFNQETWDFNGGKQWTKETKNKFVELAGKPYVKRISILGGEPLADENITEVYFLFQTLKNLYPQKKIWLYTGYLLEDIWNSPKDQNYNALRALVITYTDIFIDGQFKLSKQDINHKTHKWVGSTNQRVIDVGLSFKENKIILYKGVV